MAKPDTKSEIKVTLPQITEEEKQNPMKFAQQKYVKAEKRKKELHQIYKDQKKVPMYLSPSYRPWFGKVMRVMINGISIWFKVDGSMQEVPKTFANEITRRRKAIDRQINRQQKMASVPANNERSPGELNLF